jgi:hypothetical protein
VSALYYLDFRLWEGPPAHGPWSLPYEIPPLAPPSLPCTPTLPTFHATGEASGEAPLAREAEGLGDGGEEGRAGGVWSQGGECVMTCGGEWRRGGREGLVKACDVLIRVCNI